MNVDDVIEFVLGEADTAARWRLIDALDHPDFILRLRQATIREALNDAGGQGVHGTYPEVAANFGAVAKTLRNIMSKKPSGPKGSSPLPRSKSD